MSSLKKLVCHVLVCEHKTCLKQGGRASAIALKRALTDGGVHKRVMVTPVDCLDQCGRGPVMVVYPDGVWYGGVDEKAARRIVSEHLAEGRAVGENVLRDMRDAPEAER